jgi:hypothetical protein
MRYDLIKVAVHAFCASVLLGSMALGQEIGGYMSYSWDQASGDFYAYSQLTADYSTAYYYSLCAGMALVQTPDSGSPVYSSSSTSCSGTGDEEVSWYTTVTTAPVVLDLEGEDEISMDYYASQFEECDYGYYWDAYEAAFLDGETYGGPENFYLPGPPGQGVPEEEFYLSFFAQTSSQVPTSVTYVNTVSQGSAVCSAGQAGYSRMVTLQLLDQGGAPIRVAGTTVADTITVATPNALGVSGTVTGSTQTNYLGQWPDSYYACAAACPASTGTASATQAWTANGTPLAAANSIVYACNYVTIDGH